MPREYQFPFELRHLVYFREVARQLHFRAPPRRWRSRSRP
jgi:hypothetical protein